MVLTKVPITPQWNLTNGCVCTPDGGFLYVGSRSINYVGPLEQGDGVAHKSPQIKVFQTRQSIMSIDVDPGWPKSGRPIEVGKPSTAGAQQKYFAALAQDNSVQIWDFDRGCAVSGHKAHFSTALYMEGNGPSPQGDHVLLSYMKNRNVLSMNAQDLVVYCVASNTYCRRQMFVSARNQTLTVLRCSPYNEHIFAVGNNRGLVVIGDLQSMSTLYTLRGHEASITALSWCPKMLEPLKRGSSETKELSIAQKATKEISKEEQPFLNKDINNSKVNSNKNAKPQKDMKKSVMPVVNDDIFDIYDYDYLENEFGAPTESEKKVKDAKSADEFVGVEKAVERGVLTNFDFAEACQSLKEEIDALKNEPNYDQDDPKRMSEVTLADCQKVSRADDLSSSCGEGSRESTEGSLEIADRSSDDDVRVDGGEVNPKQQILHQAEVHAEQTNDLEKKLIEVNSEELADTIKEEKDETNSVKAEEAERDEKQELPTESNSEQPSVDGYGSQENSSTFLNNTRNTILLASASVDGNFWIWNTNTGASCDSVRPLNNGKHGKNTSIHIDWLSSTQFLTTNRTGELSLWSMINDLSLEPPKRQQWRYKFKEETQQRFQQRSVMSFSASYRSKLLWCLSSHREISCENLETGNMLLKYCCASTNVSAMRECPDDMNKIALAFSDRRVGIIDISKMSATNVFIENYISRVDASVLSLVWSPDSKKLAFGTLEGRVGIIYVEAAKPTMTFNSFCGKPIYSIDWQGDHIFVVCNEILAIYDESLENKDAHIIREVQSVSTVSVRGHILYVGTQRGHIQVYHRNPSLPYSYILMQDVPLAPRYITEISWSAIASDHVAVVANANNIHILKSISPDGLLTPVRRIEIKNSKAANACVKWSNRNAAEFLTCGFDGGVRVWDLNSTTNDEKFLKQFPCPMTCGLFLPTDEQIVMCAGKSTSIELFDMRLEQSVVYSASKWKRSNTHTLESVKWALKVPTRPDAAKPVTAAEKRRAKRTVMGSYEETSGAVEGANGAEHDESGEVVDLLGALKLREPTQKCSASEKNAEAEVSAQQQVVKKNENKLGMGNTSVFMKKSTTVFNLTTKELNKDVLEKLNMALDSSGNKNLLCAKLFGTKADAKHLLAEELKHHRYSRTTGIPNLFMTQLNSSIREEILNCIQSKQLSEWHVAVAPTISYGFWQKCCQAFADQLLEQGYALQAATYIIAMHHHIEAIEMLMSKHYYKEALIIGRIHLQKDDPLLNDISDKWITHLDMTGNLTGSALLCVLSGQLNRAYETLSKVRNVHPEIERVLGKMKSKEPVRQ
ncbi:protein rigor mortis [Anastrepha obliqua]|uniref:protein rigor mortis n=1 Tax=Anastrepha obliqua TaxID=95512 RepID=UPI00240A08A3|nr:protein rigor mortis [Anastrepha obliqua]